MLKRYDTLHRTREYMPSWILRYALVSGFEYIGVILFFSCEHNRLQGVVTGGYRT
jgi:hypothetical protein